MAIDISSDLNITLLAQNIATPTISGVYDAGSPPGTYVPGKDFSPVDAVSTGTTAELNFSIAFDSLSNQLYNLDKVFIQSVDDPRTDGAGLVPGRWINQNPDPSDITDDGLNTIIPNYNGNMSSIVFDSTANIKSDSTLTTGITLALSIDGFWWKSKLMPKIRVVAEKDGIQKVSDPLQLPTILLSTAGILRSTMGPNGSITYSGQPSVPGFRDAIFITTDKQPIPGITRILDQPDFDLITYQVAYAPTVNGTAIPLTTANFTIPFVNNGTLESVHYAGGVLTVVVRQTNPGAVSLSPAVFIPFDAAGLDEATVTISAHWAVIPPTVTGFVNGYLFTQAADGDANRTVVVDTSGQPPVLQPYVQNTISATLRNSEVGQTLTVINYPCFRTQSSIILRMIDSQVASFGPSLAPTYSFYDVNTGPVGGPMPAGSYTALYGHYDFPAGYDPNALAQAILTGAIPMTDYASVVGVPNLMAVVLLQDLYAGHTVDDTKQTYFQFTGDLDVLTQAEFAALYNSDPKDSYPSHIYNYMALNTCYTTTAEGQAAVGSVLSGVDAFRLRNGLVYLDLGTTAPPADISVQRFGATSFVRADLPLDTIDALLSYTITRMDGLDVTTITDYVQTYCIMVRWGYQPGRSAFTHIPAGTTLTVTLPASLLPYIYLAGVPQLRIPINGMPDLQVPITQYALSGTQLTITLPIDADLQPDSICVPVKFLTPSDDLTSTLQSLTWDLPLVYTQDPGSLLYGFTTDSLLFRVASITNPFTLKGAQLDTTGLSVFPEVYERGQAVTYIATVYNQSYAPDSDYCMAMTVPTNQYNPVESSNNILTAHITSVNLTNPDTVLYFQTAANVTALDIQVVKNLNAPGVPNLQTYFNTVVQSTWTRYTGQALPAGVVLLIACTPDVPQNSLVRVDYNVVMDVPAGDNTLYTNDAVFNYYSAGANLQAQSNMVTIRNRVAEALPITKAPSAQIHPLQNGVTVAFDAYFTAPLDPLIFKNFTITDVLHPSVTPDLNDVELVIYPNTPVAHTVAYDPATHTLTATVDNTAQTAGRVLALHIGTTVTDISLIPIDPLYQLPAFYNTAVLSVNHDPSLSRDSNQVLVFFQPAPPVPVPIVKAPQDQVKPRENDTPVAFTLTFEAPAAVQSYTHFTITDTLHPALALTSVTVTADGSNIPISSQYDPATGLVTVDFDNDALTAGKTIVVTLNAVVTDVTKLPAGNIIENAARLTLNRNSALYDDSNLVTVRFPVEPERCRAITDLVASVAMEQAALAHILNAEGEKLQRAMTMPLTPAQLLEVNRSVSSMLDSVTLLEHVLKRKIETVDCGLCGEC